MQVRLRSAAMLRPELKELLMEAAETIDRLEEWKDSATNILDDWDKVYNALGQPGPLGGSKALNSLKIVKTKDF